MESKKINQLATELTPSLSDLTIIGDPSTGISKKITLSQMASLFTGTVEEYPNVAAFPLVGVADTIYIALDTNVLYRWDTTLTSYVELSPNIINSLVFNDANGFDGTIALVGSVATLTITTALTTGSVGFIGASGALLQDNANFFWDDTNNRLGIGTNAPTTAIDAFGSGIIGRLNGTSTNNAFLGFASAGTNRWSIGNVQSDHRFRIYNEATTSELVSILSTGEFGIGIENPTTKLHIDGGASALIANLDANVSVAKSVSFRSDNSNRINLEVSGTESGSNAGANLFLRTYTDLGALIETPFSIVRSTGVTTIKSLTLTNALSIANGGTGSTTQNFVDLTNAQTVAGLKTFTNGINTSAYSSLYGLRISGNDVTNTVYSGAASMGITADSGYNIFIGQANAATTGLNINTSTGAAIFSSSLRAASMSIGIAPQTDKLFIYNASGTNTGLTIQQDGTGDIFRANGNGGANRFNITQAGSIQIKDGTLTGSGGFEMTSEAFFGARFQSNAYKFMAGNNSTEYMRITSGGLVGIGTTDVDAQFKVFSNSATNLMLATTTKSSVNIVAQKQGIGYTPLQIDAENQQFLTSGTERMRITSNGHIWIGQTSTSDPVSSNIAGIAFEGSLGSGKFSRGGNAALDVNRVTNDGELQRFYQDGIQEGSISVSGATVSYNSFLGSHWSQLKDGSKTEILKGTILEAIDELCVWENETNDRLPKSKISDIIESKNVYGTFFDWDNDWNGSNDFYVSSVGLGFIRINENETIEIGDLLQSNGDGTAKVQSDNIMRSSTIAKVVSTNKIETYKDGSYLIAATLHCG